MKFLPVVDLWVPSINAAVRTGQLRLLPGQWVRCGQSRPSRWVGVTSGGSLWAVHPHGADGVSNSRFRELLTVYTGRTARKGGAS